MEGRNLFSVIVIYEFFGPQPVQKGYSAQHPVKVSVKRGIDPSRNAFTFSHDRT